MASLLCLKCIQVLTLCIVASAQCEGVPECEKPKSSSLLQRRVHNDATMAGDVADQLANLATVVSQMQQELHELKHDDKETQRETFEESQGNRGSQDVVGLLNRLHQGPHHKLMQERSPTCARAPHFVHPKSAGTNATESAALTSESVHSNLSNAETSSCADGDLKLMDFTPHGASTSCCPLSKMECSGCASFSGGTCHKCEGGFIKRGGVCVSCASSSDWVSEAGLSCLQIASSDCNDIPVKGQSSNQACCTCGGGHLTPTPFEYPRLRWSLSSEILLKPEPRTADRYTVDSACELAAHNLTMDGSTGVISYVSGKDKPKEGFSFQCEVTAHQAPQVSLTAIVTLAADYLNYKSEALVFHSSTTAAPLGSSSWHKFAMTCAPEVPWLHLNSQSGTLSLTSASSSGGVSVVDDFLGQDGAVCVVSAWLHNPAKQHQTSFAVLKPRPWPSLQYDLASVSVSLGQELPPLKPQVHSEPGTMKPFTFNMACSVSGSSGSSFFYDRLLHMGFVDGHSVLELDLDGQITVAPAATLTSLFDRSTQDQSRKSITLSCRIFGIFPDVSLHPVQTTMTIHIQDSICWVNQAIRGVAILDAAATSSVQCRSRCRSSEVCANYRFASGSCLRYDVRQDGQEVTVNAKVTNCTEASCMQVIHGKWYLAGRYYPMGYDALKGGIIYRREHVTPQDAVYLYRHRPGDSCSASQWILQKIAEGDYADASRGIFELKGPSLECLAHDKVHFALNACPTAPLQWEQEDEEALPSLVLDDPGTPDAADYWLHPCDCVATTSFQAPTLWFQDSWCVHPGSCSQMASISKPKRNCKSPPTANLAAAMTKLVSSSGMVHNMVQRHAGFSAAVIPW